MKKTINLALVLLLIFTLTACAGNDVSDKSAKPTKSADGNLDVSHKPMPEDVPVYPGATLVKQLGALDNSSNCIYSTNAGGNEIVEFFKTEFQKLGFEIDEDHAYVDGEKFYVAVDKYTVIINNVDKYDDLPGEVNPDTPGRHYSILVNIDRWDDR